MHKILEEFKRSADLIKATCSSVERVRAKLEFDKEIECIKASYEFYLKLKIPWDIFSSSNGEFVDVVNFYYNSTDHISNELFLFSLPYITIELCNSSEQFSLTFPEYYLSCDEDLIFKREEEWLAYFKSKLDQLTKDEKNKRLLKEEARKEAALDEKRREIIEYKRLKAKYGELND